jgi:CRP-like cAMP-binding protein
MNKRAYQAKKQIIEVLSNHFVFGSAWTQSKILAMASVLTRHTYKLGQVLFDIGDESTGFVIVSSGAVGLKMLFEQTADNLWPAQDGLSEVCPYSKKIAVLVGQLGVGDFCGEDCVIGITRRQYRAVATAEDTEVFVVNQPDAIRFLSAEDIETIQEMTAEFYLPQAVIHKRCLESLRRKLLYSSLRDSAMGLKYKAMKSGLQERRKLQQRSPPRTHFVPRLSRGSATSRNEAAQEDESARPRFLSEPTEVLASRQSHQRASREFQQASGTTRSKNKKRISL